MWLAVGGLLVLAACSGNKKDGPRPSNPFKDGSKPQLTQRDLKLEAAGLYRQAREALESSDYASATLRYDQIAQRFPFTEYATQAELEKVYSLHKTLDADGALLAADRFIKEHPRHPAVDYVQYLKGLAQYERDLGLLDAIGVDNSKEDPTFARRSFEQFGLLLQKYPNSKYVGDARLRMVFLRNRLASHDLSIVKFYLRRGAYLAAAKRAENIVATYPGAPASLEALQAMITAYEKLGLTEQAADSRSLLLAQKDERPAAVVPSNPEADSLFNRLVKKLGS
jgi:outer membrane protein assembly factor BamD